MKGVLEETYMIFWVEEDAREDGTGGWWSGRFPIREFEGSFGSFPGRGLALVARAEGSGAAIMILR